MSNPYSLPVGQTAGSYAVSAVKTAEPQNLTTAQVTVDSHLKAIFERMNTLEQRLQPVLVPQPPGEAKPDMGAPMPLMSPARNLSEGHINGLRAIERDLCGILARLDLP